LLLLLPLPLFVLRRHPRAKRRIPLLVVAVAVVLAVVVALVFAVVVALVFAVVVVCFSPSS
jgi:hypothetical protein